MSLRRGARPAMRGPVLAAFLVLALLVGAAVWATGPLAGPGDHPAHSHGAAADREHGSTAQLTTAPPADPTGAAAATLPSDGVPPAHGTDAGQLSAADRLPAQGPETGSPGPASVRQHSLADAAAVEPPRKSTAGGAPDRTANLVERGAAAPQEVLGATPGLGGCLAEYGAAGQCLPEVPPSLSAHLQDMVDAGIDPSTMQHHWTCSEVRSYFPDGLDVRVVGTDPQQLDSNADGTACGPAD